MDVITKPIKNTVFEEYLNASVINANVNLEITSATRMIYVQINACVSSSPNLSFQVETEKNELLI